MLKESLLIIHRGMRVYYFPGSILHFIRWFILSLDKYLIKWSCGYFIPQTYIEVWSKQLRRGQWKRLITASGRQGSLLHHWWEFFSAPQDSTNCLGLSGQLTTNLCHCNPAFRIPMKSFQRFGDHNNKCMASMVWSVINPLLQCQRNSGFRSKQAFQNWCNCPFLHNLQPWAKLVCKIATKSAEFSKSDNVTFLLFLC